MATGSVGIFCPIDFSNLPISRTLPSTCRENNTISVYNNGKGIPVVTHKDEKMYVPTMIFGHLLTSSNFNDEEQKVGASPDPWRW